MSTDTTVKQLMINKLTEAQYDTAVQGGVIGPNELSFVTDMDIEVIQVDTIPTADASEAGNIYQYTGATDANYTHGYFYECVGAGSPVVYSWVQTNTQPGQVNSDWNAVSGVSQILNKPSLATVATSGDYADLINTPTIPTVDQIYDGTSTNAQSGVAVASAISGKVDGNAAITGATKCKITYDSKGLVTSGADLQASDIPSITLSKISDVTATASELNVLDGITASTTELNYVDGVTSAIQTQIDDKQAKIPAGTSGEVVTYSGTAGTIGSTALATVATSGSYSDLSNTPTLGTMAAEDASDYTPTASLATVATSGLYSDLTGTPTIPTVNDATITITQGGVTKGSFTLNQSSGDTIALDAGGGSSLPSQTGHSGEFLTTDGTDASWAAITIPCILLDYVVTASTGVISIETNKAPTTKTVKEVVGGATIAGTWTTTDTTHYVFTPTTASDILDNANGFMIKVA